MSKPDKFENDGAHKNSAADLALVERVLAGDRVARGQITQLVDAIIKYQNQRLCKKYCHGNYRHHQCTLRIDWHHVAHEAPLCEWGNAGYAWMLEDLTRETRLRRYDGRNGAGLKDYMFQIANSLPFFERWKDWRFGRRVHVPTYVRELGPGADRVFYGMVDGEDLAHLAQHLQFSLDQVQAYARQIILELTRRNRLYLLDPPKTLSLTGMHSYDLEDDSDQADIATWDSSAEDEQMRARLQQAWAQLTAVEQFVLEAMLVDETDAHEVLAALERLGLTLEEGGAPLDRQRLYYFRRKTLAKLSGLVRGDT